MTASVVAIVAVVIAALSFLASQREVRRRAKHDYVEDLEGRIADCEADRTELRRQVQALRSENIDLLRRIVRLEAA